MILVTGATGNVGGELVNSLINAGEQVRALTRSSGDEIIVLTWLDRARRDVLRVHPRGDVRNPEREEPIAARAEDARGDVRPALVRPGLG